MSAKYITAIRKAVRQVLRDEYVADVTPKWEDDELDIHIQLTLGEISEKAPYEYKETLTTTKDSRDITISSIDDLLEVDKIEWPTGSDPPDFHDVTVFGTTLTMNVDNAPTESGKNVYLYCRKLHTVTEDSSTLSPQIENVLVLGVAAYAVLSYAQSRMNKVNVGGGRAPSELDRWGMTRLAMYKSALRRLAPPRTVSQYSRS